jgi:hypothetical protein
MRLVCRPRGQQTPVLWKTFTQPHRSKVRFPGLHPQDPWRRHHGPSLLTPVRAQGEGGAPSSGEGKPSAPVTAAPRALLQCGYKAMGVLVAVSTPSPIREALGGASLPPRALEAHSGGGDRVALMAGVVTSGMGGRPLLGAVSARR